ncbi:hypothetical protein J3R08_002625 [Micromonospora sp. HB375]|uniref:hypothetical protein n=1 Tax=unclassified Micromonospora TaxID=2617518 RepID=UPI001AEA683C|nr:MULTISPECIES: hypothetical protein [unclassified Micromonospora]MBP1782775.1 hypothetical protein [Micromonospora sp. HB375]MDH6472814.1 hypothetical protein [Micromonospora sp. H404/HB375]
MNTGDQEKERKAHASLIAFILRARRTEEHSLARDRTALVSLAQMRFKIQVTPSTGMATWIQEFPPEEQVESAAARVRPLILNDDPTYYGKALKALGYLLHIAGAPEPVMQNLRGLKAEWTSIQPKGRDVRGYYLQVSKAGSGEFEQLTDNVLGFAWIYGDVVHADAERLAETRTFGVRERFRAAVPLIAQIMVLTIATLNFIRFLHENGMVSGLDTAFDTEVIVTETNFRAEGRVFLGEPDSPDQPMTIPIAGHELGENWKPIHQVLGPPSPAPASPES